MKGFREEKKNTQTTCAAECWEASTGRAHPAPRSRWELHELMTQLEHKHRSKAAGSRAAQNDGEQEDRNGNGRRESCSRGDTAWQS